MRIILQIKEITFLLIVLLIAFNISVQATTPTASIAVASTETTQTYKPAFKVSGYIHAEYQWGQPEATLKIGSPNENLSKSFSRIGMRRGFMRAMLEYHVASGVFSANITERGVGLQELFLNIKTPLPQGSGIRMGVFDRPFGFEIGYSSALRESPERSIIIRTLFPDDRDLGAMVILSAPERSAWSFLKLEAGLFAGNGIKPETDSYKDFIGHLSASKQWNRFDLQGGISYYDGGVYQGTNNVYKMEGKSFVLNSNESNIGKFAKRRYLGLDAMAVLRTNIGTTKLRTEYIGGVQPSQEFRTQSPNSALLPDYDTYIRRFNGGYLLILQQLGKLPVSAIFKYEWYDPNTNVADNDIGQGNTNASDISRDIIALGLLGDLNKNIRFTAYFEINGNEQSQNLAGYNRNIMDNAFTFRTQYRF